MDNARLFELTFRDDRSTLGTQFTTQSRANESTMPSVTTREQRTFQVRLTEKLTVVPFSRLIGKMNPQRFFALWAMLQTSACNNVMRSASINTDDDVNREKNWR